MSKKLIKNQRQIEDEKRHNDHVRSERKKNTKHWFQIIFFWALVIDGICLLLIPSMWWEFWGVKSSFISFGTHGLTAAGSWILSQFLEGH